MQGGEGDVNRAIERYGTPRNASETTIQMWSGKTGRGIRVVMWWWLLGEFKVCARWTHWSKESIFFPYKLFFCCILKKGWLWVTSQMAYILNPVSFSVLLWNVSSLLSIHYPLCLPSGPTFVSIHMKEMCRTALCLIQISLVPFKMTLGEKCWEVVKVFVWTAIGPEVHLTNGHLRSWVLRIKHQ